MSSNSNNAFRLNVGFIVHQSVGYSREFPFEYAYVFIPPDLELKNLTGSVRVSRLGQGLLVQTQMQAEMVTTCSRCLVEFKQPLKIDFTEFYAFTPKAVTESGLILPENGQINLAPLIREEMLLAMPINPICKPECLGLCPVCGENLNETSCNHEEQPVDPRLEVLKTLLDKK